MTCLVHSAGQIYPQVEVDPRKGHRSKQRPHAQRRLVQRWCIQQLAITFLFASSVQASLGLAQTPDSLAKQPERYTIQGQVTDAQGQPVPRSLVIPFTEDGLPIAQSTGSTVTAAIFEDSKVWRPFLSSTTDEDGNFQIELDTGTYRLIAQSWLDSADAPKNLIEENGRQIRLDGIAKFSFSNGMEAVEPISIKPVGTAGLKIKTTTSDPLLVVSTHAMRFDPVLGFAAWDLHFASGIIGVNQMIDESTTIVGLPAGTIQLAAFANDNNPGFGGITTEVFEDQVVSVELPIIASWSNGHKTPPDRLLPLINHMKQNPEDAKRVQKRLKEQMDKSKNKFVALHFEMGELMTEEIQLSDQTQQRLGDCLAAIAYMRLRDMR